MDVITERIKQIEDNVFEYNVDGINNDVVNMFSLVIENNVISGSDAMRLTSLNGIMGACLKAMQNCDYLLLADLLKYRLTPLLGGVE